MKHTLGRIFLGLAAVAAVAPGAARAAEPPPFAWKDGDRVVLIGDTLVERDQKYGYLETIVTAQNPDKSIVFRNLGWSGDTVLGLSRAGFGKPPEGFQHLKDHVLALKPTVLIVGYGMTASFDGEAGLPTFVSNLNTLLDTLAPLKARLVLLSPIAHEDLGRPLPDPAKHNRDLARYRDAIKKVAGERSAWFIDLYEPTLSARDYGINPLTDNGIHPTAFGHWYLATVIDMDLRRARKEAVRNIRVDRKTSDVRAAGAKVEGVESTPNGVRFRVTDATLPIPAAPGVEPDAIVWGAKRVLTVTGLDRGSYGLAVDGKKLAASDAGIWSKGVRLTAGPEFDQVEALRQAINAKNELYFYRWRPQNETYLFGFRKYEQGNNAREIPLFDPLVEEREKEIAKLKVAVPHLYELTREKESEVSR